MNQRKNYNLTELGAVISVDELSSVMKISRSKAYELVRKQNFPKLTYGKRILIPTEALLNWLNENIGCCI